MAGEINVSDLIAEFGEIYIDQGQVAEDIKTQLFEADDIEMDFTTVPESNSSYRSVFASVDEVLQAFTTPFTKKSISTFKPHSTEMGEFKIDVARDPDEFWKTYLGFFVGLPEVDRAKWPVIRWLIQKQLIPRAQEDYILEVIYFGWKITDYNGLPTVDGPTFVRELADDSVAQPANGAMDGIKVQIAKLVDSGRVVPHVMGAVSADPVTFVNQVEAMRASIAPKLRRKIDKFYMSIILWERFKDGMREKYNVNYQSEADETKIRHSEIVVVGTVSMTGSDQIWGTIPQNKKRPIKSENSGAFDIQKTGRTVEMLSDWKKLVTFDVPEFIVTNDSDVTISAQDIIDRY